MDIVFIERVRRSLKYECVYLDAFETTPDARAGFDYYNGDRPHLGLAGRVDIDDNADNTAMPAISR